MIMLFPALTTRLRGLAADRAGAALVEFALIMPVLLLISLGSLEFGLNIYMRSVLEGAMLEAGRNSSLQTGSSNQTAIDQAVTKAVKNIIPNATVTFERDNYPSYSKLNKPEDFTDTNGNGRYDSGECFQDVNNNNTWDSDLGRDGLGGANDIVEYVATVRYPTFVPVGQQLGLATTTTVTAKTVLKNQPFATQPGWGARQICP